MFESDLIVNQTRRTAARRKHEKIIDQWLIQPDQMQF